TPYTPVSPALDKLKQFLTSSAAESEPAAAPVATTSGSGIDLEAVKKELAGSPGKIMTFCGIPAEEAKQLLDDLKTLAGMQNPLDSGGDPRKLRRRISKVYWSAYEKAYFKNHAAKGDVPKNVQLMLDFGFFDETLLQDEHIAALYELKDTTRASAEYP